MSELISRLSRAIEKKSFLPCHNQQWLFLFSLIFAVVTVFVSCLPYSHAAEVQLEWNASDGASGYNIYCGSKSRDYENKIDVGNNLKFTVTDLNENQVYYFAVTAYNAYGESDFSIEKSHLVALSSDTLNFGDYVIESYGADQDRNAAVAIKDKNATIHIRGNGWKKVYFPYTLTPNTVIEFDFKSSRKGEIHGIGFDDDDDINNPIKMFQLHGTQAWGIPDFNDYQGSAPNWKHYRIPVGRFYTGEMLYLTMTNDHDAAPNNAQSYFSNIKVYEGLAALNFRDFVIEPYGTGQDQNGADQDRNAAVAIRDKNATIHIRGNGWKKVYFPYTLTPNTVIEFDFKSSRKGEIHGIGFDDDDDINNPIKMFQLHGTQAWGIPDFNDYQGSAPNWKHYRIPVGRFYTGEMLYLTMINDHDAAPNNAQSYFSNIRVFDYETQDDER